MLIFYYSNTLIESRVYHTGYSEKHTVLMYGIFVNFLGY